MFPYAPGKHFWHNTSTDHFSTSSAYHLTLQKTNPRPTQFIHSFLDMEINHFTKNQILPMLFLHVKLPMTLLLRRRNISSTTICKICSHHTEDISHIFLHYKNAFTLWQHFGNTVPSHDFSTWLQHQCTTTTLIHTTSNINLPSSILILVYGKYGSLSIAMSLITQNKMFIFM